MIHPMLDISLVDFSDPYDICGFVSLLCQVGNNFGMTAPEFTPTVETNQIRQLANKVVRRIEEQLPLMSVADALMSVSSYGLAYRLAYLKAPDYRLINRYVLKAFDSLIHGDRSVDEYLMYEAISQGLQRCDRAYFDKPLIWHSICNDRWHKEALDGFHPDRLTEYDIINRVALLLQADLTAYEGRHQDEFKRELFEEYRHYLDIHDNADRHILRAVDRLLAASLPYLTPEEQSAYSTLLNEEKQLNSSTSRFLRVALKLSRSIA